MFGLKSVVAISIVALACFSGCGDDGGGDERGADGPAGSGDDGQVASSGSGDDASEASDDTTPAPGSDSGDDTDTGGPLGPVQCDGVECAPGEICVAPGLTCNYDPCSERPPGEAEWVTPPRVCVPAPSACELDDPTCLADELCGDAMGAPPLMDGVLLCPVVSKDCFCVV